eukprot:9347405-Lingulodinium_polyedra.AAC.1
MPTQRGRRLRPRSCKTCSKSANQATTSWSEAKLSGRGPSKGRAAGPGNAPRAAGNAGRRGARRP